MKNTCGLINCAWRSIARLLCISITCFAALDASAQWVADPSLNTAICALPEGQGSPVITALGAGEVAIAWQDMRRGGQYPDVYMQKASSSGQLQWPDNGTTLTLPATGCYSQQLIPDGEGGVICAWTRLQTFGTTGTIDIFAQRINSAGVAMWGPGGVPVCTNLSAQERPQLVSDGSGGAIITWEDSRPGINHDIYAQRVDANGQVQWATDGVPVCADVSRQELPKLVPDGAGGAVVCWGDERYGSSILDVFAQRIDSNGERQWTTTGVLVTAAQPANIYEICSDGAGGAIVVYNYYGGFPFPSSSPVYAQRINNAGALMWSPDLRLSTPATASAPTIVEDGSGGAVIAWQQGASPTTFGNISAQRMSADGSALWGSGGITVSSVPLIHQRFPKIIGTGGGATIVSWQDDRNGSADLFAQKLSASGVVEWAATGVTVTSAPGIQTSHQIASNGAGGAVITWSDSRGADMDIYAAMIEALGNQSAIGWEMIRALSGD